MSKSAVVGKGWVNFRLNIRLKGYVYRQHLYPVRFGNGSTITLLQKFFTQRNIVTDFIRLNLSFIYKNNKFAS